MNELQDFYYRKVLDKLQEIELNTSTMRQAKKLAREAQEFLRLGYYHSEEVSA